MKLAKIHVVSFMTCLSLILVIALLPQPAYSSERPEKKVTVAYPTLSPFALWYLLGKDLGFFREEGLEPEFVLVRGGGIAVKGLIAGNFDYIIPTGPAADAIIRSQYPLRIVFTASLVHFWLVAQPEIRSIEDLKGKVIGISSRGSNTDLTIQEIFKQHKLDPLKDATFLNIGSFNERFAALTSRAVHATVLSSPFNYKAVEMGFRKLATASDYVKWPAVGLSTTEQKILRDPQETIKMVKASLKGMRFILGQREYVIAKIMERFRFTREEAIQGYDTLHEVFVPSGYFAPEIERKVIFMIKQSNNIAEDIPPERVFDNRFVKQAEQELKGWKP